MRTNHLLPTSTQDVYDFGNDTRVIQAILLPKGVKHMNDLPIKLANGKLLNSFSYFAAATKIVPLLLRAASCRMSLKVPKPDLSNHTQTNKQMTLAIC
jgi:hypothetical protein